MQAERNRSGVAYLEKLSHELLTRDGWSDHAPRYVSAGVDLMGLAEQWSHQGGLRSSIGVFRTLDLRFTPPDYSPVLDIAMALDDFIRDAGFSQIQRPSRHGGGIESLGSQARDLSWSATHFPPHRLGESPTLEDAALDRMTQQRCINRFPSQLSSILEKLCSSLLASHRIQGFVVPIVVGATTDAPVRERLAKSFRHFRHPRLLLLIQDESTVTAEPPPVQHRQQPDQRGVRHAPPPPASSSLHEPTLNGVRTWMAQLIQSAPNAELGMVALAMSLEFERSVREGRIVPVAGVLGEVATRTPSPRPAPAPAPPADPDPTPPCERTPKPRTL